jgi:Helix-turn-helix domain
VNCRAKVAANRKLIAKRGSFKVAEGRPLLQIGHEPSSGNVHADLGFADAAEMLAKARIVSRIGRIIQARKLTQAQAQLPVSGLAI